VLSIIPDVGALSVAARFVDKTSRAELSAITCVRARVDALAAQTHALALSKLGRRCKAKVAQCAGRCVEIVAGFRRNAIVGIASHCEIYGAWIAVVAHGVIASEVTGAVGTDGVRALDAVVAVRVLGAVHRGAGVSTAIVRGHGVRAPVPGGHLLAAASEDQAAGHADAQKCSNPRESCTHTGLPRDGCANTVHLCKGLGKEA